MSDQGKSIMEAISYLDAFYKDVGLLFSNFETLLAEVSFRSHPRAGNMTTYSYTVSNHISRSNNWILKNIQRLYLKEDEIESQSKLINKALICSLALYPSSAFEMPVLVCGRLRWEGGHDLDGIFNSWPNNEICDAIKVKNNWRLANQKDTDKIGNVYRLKPLDKSRNIDEYAFFVFNLIKVENSKALQDIVTAMVELYNESEDIPINTGLIEASIPDKLLATWQKPIIEG